MVTTVLVANGVGLRTVQHRLGHSDPRMTLAVYAQVTRAADRSAADTLAGSLTDPTDEAASEAR